MEKQTKKSSTIPKPSPVQWMGLVLVYALIPAVLIVCGGDLRWWEAWVYSVIIFITGVGGRILAEKLHPGLMAERVKFGKSTNIKKWDKILAPLMSITISFPLYITAGLDHRFGWSNMLPTWIEICGFILTIGGYTFGIWALAVNRYFSGVVRIQNDRGHTVCDKGPYRIVRHPGYAGNLLPLAGIPLALSSFWTFIPAAVALAIAILRTVLEDRTLQKELPGYKEYSERVRYRLFPGIF